MATNRNEYTIKITDGHVQFIYADALADLLTTGTAVVSRVSHVEPAVEGGWTAAMLGGPVLGPFALRQQALDAEIAWLQRERNL